MSRTKLVLLGTGTPNILPTRYQSSLAIIVDDVPYLVDCGGGAVQRASQAVYEKKLSALSLKNLSRVFLTHLHPDHTTGLADLIIAPWVLDRADPLQVFGSKGTKTLIHHLLQAYETGIAEHRDGLAPINHPLEVQVTEINEGQIYEDERIQVIAFKASHGGLEAYSYKFITPDKTIIISGDTSPTQGMIEQAKECDILVHEVYSATQFATRSPEWQAYHRQSHTSTLELADIAEQTQPKLLILVHQLFWGADENDIMNEIKQHYQGITVSGNDLDVF